MQVGRPVYHVYDPFLPGEVNRLKKLAGERNESFALGFGDARVDLVCLQDDSLLRVLERQFDAEILLVPDLRGYCRYHADAVDARIKDNARLNRLHALDEYALLEFLEAKFRAPFFSDFDPFFLSSPEGLVFFFHSADDFQEGIDSREIVRLVDFDAHEVLPGFLDCRREWAGFVPVEGMDAAECYLEFCFLAVKADSLREREGERSFFDALQEAERVLAAVFKRD